MGRNTPVDSGGPLGWQVRRVPSVEKTPGPGTVRWELGNRCLCQHLWLQNGDADPELHIIPL